MQLNFLSLPLHSCNKKKRKPEMLDVFMGLQLQNVNIGNCYAF
jgi:hypothetical protein